jgi:hypothetical protein
MKKILSQKVLLIAIPFALIAAASVIMGLTDRTRGNKLENGQVYEIWIKQAEVAPMNREGKSWDMEGNAPDLMAMLSWHDQIVLTTVASTDGLIAQWDQTALEASQILKGELDAKSLQKVGRFRMNPEQSLEIGIFDDDLVSREFIKGLRIPMTSLGLGKNEWRGSGVLKNLVISLQSAEEPTKASTDITHWDSSVIELDTIPQAMISAQDQIADQFGKEAEKAINDAEKVAEDASKVMEEAGKEIQQGFDRFMRDLEKK